MVNDRQSLDLTTFALVPGGCEVEWRISAGPVPYPEAVAEVPTEDDGVLIDIDTPQALANFTKA